MYINESKEEAISVFVETEISVIEVVIPLYLQTDFQSALLSHLNIYPISLLT